MQIVFVTTRTEQTDDWVRALAAVLPQANISAWRPDSPRLNAEYAVVYHPPAAFFEQERALRAIFTMSAGVDALLEMPTLPPDVPLIRLEDAGMAVQMSEYALYALLRVARRFDDYLQQQQQSEWRPLPALNRQQWPVGVLGLGQVGASVAETIAGFGFPVLGWARSRHELPGVRGYAGAAELPAFLAGTRVLMNTLPLTTDTVNILNTRLFAQLLPQAHIVNMGRGAHLVEQDLLAALDDGTINGATLDVFRTEPLPPEHPFWHHPRVHVTPHVAAATLRDDSVRQVAEKIRQLSQGAAVSGVVARDQGY